ncbi:MAG: hypothetical protein AUK47_26375 [Deltaproteobacteria bacterium CG2_30_63_29]|nr:MAG: hypothetical protein AUK47_26375 [Deltaproteobacteria bacterium CG2_30_63_29]PIV99721.1 MAG: nucleotide sugar dehydrogenase [Deltaproteobacteria bacterium CG17_big_fil_post_rev_8_21_14_2_50_63_7]PJB38274.1 MAG: nucleotide sugar dehydrogenase [Deltaproteobacteria bacterium CG_4_9_14_3_um_filter_63_12]
MERIGIVGLGYVGLPIALAFQTAFEHVVGFDHDPHRVAQLRRGIDDTHECESSILMMAKVEFSADPGSLRGCTFFIIAAPTPISPTFAPDLAPLEAATRTVGAHLQRGGLVAFESTVYPGVIEDICVPLLEQASGLKQLLDFNVAYSPERINPGDPTHTYATITKVVAADSAEALERAASAYEKTTRGGIYRARSIRVAEAAKVLENTQRDLNIALMNELAMIFERTGLRTRDVLDVAATKWNFHPFEPGLVGGHCIGVDPYYLTAFAEAAGYHPEVILAGRRVNEGMGRFVATSLIKRLVTQGISLREARVAVLGLTYKPDVTDLRNSKVFDVLSELEEFGVSPIVHDPIVNADALRAQRGIVLATWDDLTDLDAVVLAVPHRQYLERGVGFLIQALRRAGVLFDVKAVFEPHTVPEPLTYWSL